MNKALSESVKVETTDGVTLLTISRPEALNALNQETLDVLGRILDGLREDDGARVVILTGAGEKAFVAGADIRELAQMENAHQARERAIRGQKVLDAIEGFPKPVIAAINGFALGGGCELAMACHLRVAAEEARLGQPEVKLGITPGYGGTQRLVRLVGKGVAMELILSGEMISAAEALRIGLVNRVVSRRELMPYCRRLAKTMMSNAPLALRYAIEAIHRGKEMPLREALLLEATLFGLSFGTQDGQEGLRAFTEKRKPRFEGK